MATSTQEEGASMTASRRIEVAPVVEMIHGRSLWTGEVIERGLSRTTVRGICISPAGHLYPIV